MSQEQRRERERRDGHELEEIAPGILGVGQAHGRNDLLGATEQVADLDGDEDEEEQIEQAEDGAYLDDAE